MKTVWDAVDWCRGSYFVTGKHERHHTHLVEGRIAGIYSAYASDIGAGSVICSIREYSELVAEMETNFGKYTGPRYDASKATKLEAESKVDYTSEEFWKDAPESATHYCPAQRQFSEVFIKNLTDNNYLYRVVGKNYDDDEWEMAHPIIDNELDGITERPQPKPVYTQEMYDKGELPSVGSKCIAGVKAYHNDYFSRFAGKEVEVVSHDKNSHNKDCAVFKYKDDDGFYEYHALIQDCFKPIDTRTDEEKAIDDLVDNGCPDYKATLDAIKTGKIHGVTWSKGNE